LARLRLFGWNVRFTLASSALTLDGLGKRDDSGSRPAFARRHRIPSL